jgi:hypothetical protein
MLASTGHGLFRAAGAAAAKQLAQLGSGAALAGYHAIYDVGNSTNIKWCVQLLLLLQTVVWRRSLQPLADSRAVADVLRVLSAAAAAAPLPLFLVTPTRHEGGVSAQQKEDMLSQKGCVLW